jgi:16S rRNA (cytosine1402-N4)-methyltransferase
LNPTAGRRLVDATLGGGGHAEALLDRGAEVIGVDRDPVAVAAARIRLGARPGFRAVQGRASELEALLGPLGLLPVDGVLLDLGVSSPQLETAGVASPFRPTGPWT